MKPGNVPTSRIGPLLGDLIRDRWPHNGGIEVLAEKVGCDWTAIEGIIKGVHEGVSFDLADKLFCALGRVDVWQGQLKDVYDNTQLLERCANPGCESMFVPDSHSGPTRRKYCSHACLWSAYNQRRGKTKRVIKRHRSGGFIRVCKNGHRRTPETTATRVDGKRECLLCKREAARALYREKSEKRQLNKVCLACGSPYKAYRVDQRFCNHRCRNRARTKSFRVAA